MNGSRLSANTFRLYLGSNNIAGTIPSSLKQISRLELRLEDNRIEGIPAELCGLGGWYVSRIECVYRSSWSKLTSTLSLYLRMDGAVGAIGSCDAILCPAGYFSNEGRQNAKEHPCLRCESLNVNPFFGQTACGDVSERNVLQDIFSATGGTGGKWINGDGWNSGDPICTWHGIECDGGEKGDVGVVAIKLPSNNMIGTLPTAAWLLPLLTEIDLSGNSALHVSFENVTTIPFLEKINVAGTNIPRVDGISHAVNLKNFAASGLAGKWSSSETIRKL